MKPMSLRRWMLLAALSLSSLGVQAQADAPQALRTRSLAATCAACHGTAGRALPGAPVPGLAGLPAAELIAQMKAFKEGGRTATVMPQIAKGYSDAQIEQLAAYFAAQKAEGAP